MELSKWRAKSPTSEMVPDGEAHPASLASKRAPLSRVNAANACLNDVRRNILIVAVVGCSSKELLLPS